jgi:hypothetical protein
MAGFAQYIYSTVSEIDAGRLRNPNKGWKKKWSYAFYRINRNDLIKGVIWNAPHGVRGGFHGEEEFFRQLGKALRAINDLNHLELVINWSPCYGQCWQIIKNWARTRLPVQFDIYYLDAYKADVGHTLRRDLQFGSFAPMDVTNFSMLKAEAFCISNITLKELDARNMGDLMAAFGPRTY